MISIINTLQNYLPVLQKSIKKGKLKALLDQFIAKKNQITALAQHQFFRLFPTQIFMDIALLLSLQKDESTINSALTILHILFTNSLIPHPQDVVKVIYQLSLKQIHSIQIKLVQISLSLLQAKVFQILQCGQIQDLALSGFILAQSNNSMIRNISINFLKQLVDLLVQLKTQAHSKFFQMLCLSLFKIKIKGMQRIIQIRQKYSKDHNPQLIYVLIDCWLNQNIEPNKIYTVFQSMIRQNFSKNNRIVQVKLFRLIFKVQRNIMVDKDTLIFIKNIFMDANKDSLIAFCICQGIRYVLQNQRNLVGLAQLVVQDEVGLDYLMGIVRIRTQQMCINTAGDLQNQQINFDLFKCVPEDIKKGLQIKISSRQSYSTLKQISQTFKNSVQILLKNQADHKSLCNVLKQVFKRKIQIFKFLIPLGNNDQIKELLNLVQFWVITAGKLRILEIRNSFLILLVEMCQKIEKTRLTMAGMQAARILFNILYGYQQILDKTAYSIILNIIYQLELIFSRLEKSKHHISQYFIIKDLTERLFQTTRVSEDKAKNIMEALFQMVSNISNKDGSALVFLFRVLRPLIKFYPNFFDSFSQILVKAFEKCQNQKIFLRQINSFVRDYHSILSHTLLIGIYKHLGKLWSQCSDFLSEFITNYLESQQALIVIMKFSRGHPQSLGILRSTVQNFLYKCNQIQTLKEILLTVESYPTDPNKNNTFINLGMVWNLAGRAKELSQRDDSFWLQMIGFLKFSAFSQQSDVRSASISSLSQINNHLEQFLSSNVKDRIDHTFCQLLLEYSKKFSKDQSIQNYWLTSIKKCIKACKSNCLKFQPLFIILQQTVLNLLFSSVKQVVYEGLQQSKALLKLKKLGEWKQRQVLLSRLNECAVAQIFKNQSQSYVRNKIIPTAKEALQLCI